jgi:DNA (cytosine-5)-methyltransferase 1
MTDIENHTEAPLVPLDEISPYGSNPKQHPDDQIDKIASSIRRFGWNQHLVIDDDGVIITGHGRRLAAKQLGEDAVPAIRRPEMSEAKKRAYRIADNRVAESEWDDDLLSVELELLEDSSIDAELTGFDDEELLEFKDQTDSDPVDELDEPPIEDKALEDIKILNLYAGIGGNRKLWGDKPDVTAVEYNETIAEAYQDFYPDDTVVVNNAHEYLLEHFDEFDFIWTSPPCPTHSRIRKQTRYEAGKNQENNLSEIDAVYPDLTLYEEIILLQHYFEGKYCVENVISYYDPLIEPTELERHYFWSNFNIPSTDIDTGERMHDNDPRRVEEWMGYDLSEYNFPDDYPEQKVTNNLVHPELGKHILDSALE